MPRLQVPLNRANARSWATNCVSAQGLDADRRWGLCYLLNRIKTLDPRRVTIEGSKFDHELLSHYTELHRALQMPENDTHIDAAAFLENLCLSISRSKLDGMKIDLVLTGSPLRLDVTCGVIGEVLAREGPTCRTL
jgi:hypothetical protein